MRLERGISGWVMERYLSKLLCRLSNLYKATQQARKVFRLGKSALLYTKFESILEKKVGTCSLDLIWIYSSSSTSVHPTTCVTWSLCKIAEWYTKNIRLDFIIHYTLIWVKIGFLAYDNIIFASKANVLKVDEAKAVRQGGLLWYGEVIL